MDWASRYVLACRLSNTLDTGFCTDALDEGLARHGTPEIINTDAHKNSFLLGSCSHTLGQTLENESSFLTPYITHADRGQGRSIHDVQCGDFEVRTRSFWWYCNGTRNISIA